MNRIPLLDMGGIIEGPGLFGVGPRVKEVVTDIGSLSRNMENVTQVIINIGNERLAEIVDRTLDRRKRIQQVV